MAPQNCNISLELHLSNDKRTDTDHANKFLNKFLNFYEKEEFCDTVLIAEIDKTKIQVHQIVLSVSSDYFRALFRNTLKCTTLADEIEVKAIDGTTLKSIINFMYTGSIQLCNSTVVRIIETAHYLQIDSLMTICSDFMKDNIDVSNCLGIAHFAEQYNFTALAEKSLVFASTNYEKVSGEKEFFELNNEQLCSFISREDVCVASEEIVFQSVVQWIDHDRENRVNSTLNLLRQIHFRLLTPKFIIQNILLVCNTIESHNLFARWLQWHISPRKRAELCLERHQARKGFETLVFVSYSGSSGINVQSYNPDLNCWTENILSFSLKGTKKYFAATILGNSNLIIAYDEPSSVAVKSLDLETVQWSDLPSLENEHNFCELEEVNGELYACGGILYSPQRVFNALEKYDVNTCKWQVLMDGIQAQQIDPAFRWKWVSVVNGLLYALTMDSEMQSYDPVSSKWATKAFPSHKEILAEVNGQLYAFAGRCDEVCHYNPSDDTWNTSGSLDIGECLARTSIRNRLIIYSVKQESAILTQYDPETNEKNTLASPTPTLKSEDYYKLLACKCEC